MSVAGNGSGQPARLLVELDRSEALRLLAGVSYGRIVFTLHALPAIRPVNHLVDDGEIIVRTRLTAKLTTVVDLPEPVVAYEADELDPVQRLGWSVVATGVARRITDIDRVARYERLLRPWVNIAMDTVIGIRPELVTGIRLVEAPDTAPGAASGGTAHGTRQPSS